MTAEKLLTEAACKAAKAKDKIYYLNDGAGLRLRVRPDGSRTWVFRYRLDGKELSAGLGAYPTVTLQIARVKALDAKALANTGRTLESIPEVLEAYLVSGDYDYFIRVAVEDTRGYERFLRERLYKIPGIRHSKSSFVLRRLKQSQLPVRLPN